MFAGEEAIIDEFSVVHTLCIDFHLLTDDFLLDQTLALGVPFSHLIEKRHQVAPLHDRVHIILIDAGVGHVYRIIDFHWADLFGPMFEVWAGIHLPSCSLSLLWLVALGELVNQVI